MGASLALLLAQQLPECSITLLDQHPLDTASPQTPERSQIELRQPSFDARSTALSPTTEALLKRLGVWKDVLPGATAIRSIHVSDRHRAGWVKLDETDNEGNPLGHVVENRNLGLGLAQGLAQQERVTVRAPASVQRVNMVKGGAQIDLLGDTAPLFARLVVVADGAESPLRQQLGIGAQIQQYHQHAIVANVQCTQPHKGTAFERFTSAGPLALLPIQGEHSKTMALVWSWPNDQYEQAMGWDDAAFLTELQRVFGYRLGRFTQLSQRKAYPLQLVVAEEQARSHLVVMGNAAHFLHPVAGQGFNLAARDAMRLAEVLRLQGTEELGDLDGLQRYIDLQTPDQRKTIALSDGFHRLFSNSNPIKVGLRGAGMLAIQHLPWARQWFIEQMSGKAVVQPKLG